MKTIAHFGKWSKVGMVIVIQDEAVLIWVLNWIARRQFVRSEAENILCRRIVKGSNKQRRETERVRA
jgi:hypothetical protein